MGLAFLMGLRHGADPDHLTAIDGLSQIRPGRWNGVLFALGHTLVVTLLAFGVAGIAGEWLNRLGPWLLLTVAGASLFRLLAPASPGSHRRPGLPTSSPLLLGVLFAAGFETASQISALALANESSAALVGAAFGGGMVIVDGIDGFNAFAVQRARDRYSLRTQQASRALSVIVIVSSIGLAAAELFHYDLGKLSVVAGGALFCSVAGFRLWVRRGPLGKELP